MRVGTVMSYLHLSKAPPKLFSFSVLEIPYGRVLITTWKGKVSRCAFHVSYQSWSRSCTRNPRGAALSRWWAPGTCGKTLWCCVSTRKCVAFVVPACTVPLLITANIRCVESMNYTWAGLQRMKTYSNLTCPVADACFRWHLIGHSLILWFCLDVQSDRLWNSPLLRSQYDGPRGSAHGFVPCWLLHHGGHRRGNLSSTMPCGRADGSAWRAAHIHDHNSPGITAAAGFA